jgi:hypothetical protein
MKQGYMDRLKESLAMRQKGAKKQSLKERADESKGMEKASGRKAFSSVAKMDKGSKKLSGLSKEHAKEYEKYSPQQLKKHMKGEKALLTIKLMAKKKK